MGSNELLINSLLQEYSSRWQEILAIESEVSTWSTIYLTGVLAAIAWTLGRDKGQTVKDALRLNRRQSPIYLLTLALLNSIFILALAVKSYNIQEIALYIHENLAPRLRVLTGEPFDFWEEWRRIHASSSGRQIFYASSSLLPLVVSAALLRMYRDSVRTQTSRRRVSRPVAFVIGIQVIAIGSAVWMTATMHLAWRREVSTSARPTNICPVDAALITRNAVRGAARIAARMRVSPERVSYDSLLADTYAQFEEQSSTIVSNPFRASVDSMFGVYMAASRIWTKFPSDSTVIQIDGETAASAPLVWAVGTKVSASRLREGLFVEGDLRRTWLEARLHHDCDGT